MNSHAHPTHPSAAASFHGAATPSLELLEARRLRDALKLLLSREQHAMAEFLISLADFDLRRGWEALGHASLFAFITTELGLTPAPTYWRVEAARLLQRFPDLVEPLRRGRLCLTTMGELAKVLTEENREAVLPRFLGISSRDAKEIVAELQPRPAPPVRTVVTPLAPGRATGASLVLAPGPSLVVPVPRACPPSPGGGDTDSGSLWAPNVEVAAPAPMAPRRDDIDPLTAELSRLSTTVSRRFLQKLKAARAGLSHASPGATTEQVLERALDLLLEKQARARGQVKRPRRAVAIPPAEIRSSLPTPSSQPTHVEAATPATNEIPIPLEPPLHRRAGPRETIPAAVRRAVWERDQGCCSWPLDAGGRCGSTHRLELDHVIPWARDGEPKVENLRLLCGRHNRLAARQVFGNACVDRYAGPGSRKEGQQEGQQGVLSV